MSKVEQTRKKTGGRKAGTPNKATAEIKSIAQQYTQDAINCLANIMLTSDSHPARVSAAKELLDRGHGKATQSVTGDINMKFTGLKVTVVGTVN